MANSECTSHCVVCGGAFAPKRRDAKYCCGLCRSRSRGAASKAAFWREYYARHGDRLRANSRTRRRAKREPPRPRPCRQCGSEFTPKIKRGWFCSKPCQQAARVRRPAIENARRRRKTAIRRELLPRRACRHCGRSFKPRRRSTAVYCSERCGIAAWDKRKKAERRAQLPLVECAGCGKRFQARRAGVRTCGDRCAKRAWVNLNKDRAHEAVLRRRARLKGVFVESVNRIAVFVRDEWTCRLCGRPTPRRLIGTRSPDRPTVDHIVPVSRGGEHAYHNVQCVCSRCNSRKGATVRGQFRLF